MSNSITKLFIIFMTFFAASIAYSQVSMEMSTPESSVQKNAGTKTETGTLYGKDYDHSMTAMDYTDLLKNFEASNNKVILVKGKVADVCQEMGCWMVMTDGATTIRATTNHEFFLPKDVAGKEAVIMGTFKVTEISKEEAKHYSEESKDPSSAESIKGPQKVYEIEATGIEILD